MSEDDPKTENGVYYCPDCGHKYWGVPTPSGKFEPGNKCHWCVADERED